MCQETKNKIKEFDIMIRNWDSKYLDDVYNEFGTRTRKNVEGHQFNCGGYALETYNWICPYS